MPIEHDVIPLGEIHIPHNWEYADAAARTGATGFVAADVGKWAKQLDNGTFWELTATTPTWAQRTGAGALANDSITNSLLANMATQTIKGRTTAGTGDPEDLTATQATAILNAVVGDSGAGGTKGLVPAPAAGDAAAGKFLKADGTFAVPSGTGAETGANSDITSMDGLTGAIENPTKIIFPEAAAPSTPGANKVVLYAKSDGLLYSKDDAGTESAVSGGAGASALDDLSDVTISSPSTDEVLKYNGSAWVNGAAPSGSGTFVQGQFERYKFIAFNALPASTNFQAIGASATAGGGASANNADDANGVFVRRNTAASNPDDAWVEWTNFRIDWLPQMTFKVKTYTSISVCRIFLGMASSLSSADPAENVIAFRYDTSASDTNWKAYSNDGSGGGTITDTGVAVSINTVYNFAIVVESTSSVKYYISTDQGTTYTLVATHTTNLPASGSVMNGFFGIRTLEAVSKSLLHSWCNVRMR